MQVQYETASDNVQWHENEETQWQRPEAAQLHLRTTSKQGCWHCNFGSHSSGLYNRGNITSTTILDMSGPPLTITSQDTLTTCPVFWYFDPLTLPALHQSSDRSPLSCWKAYAKWSTKFRIRLPILMKVTMWLSRSSESRQFQHPVFGKQENLRERRTGLGDRIRQCTVQITSLTNLLIAMYSNSYTWK